MTSTAVTAGTGLWSLSRSRTTRYASGALLLVLGSIVAAAYLGARPDFTDEGPLSRHQPELRAPLPGAVSLAKALDGCFPHRSSSHQYEVVGGLVRGRPYYACYDTRDGSVQSARVVDGDGIRVRDVGIIKAGGAWPWIGLVKTKTGLWLGAAAVLVLLAYGWNYYRRLRPGRAARTPPWYRTRQGWLRTLGGWLFFPYGLALLFQGDPVTRARRRRAFMQVVMWFVGFWVLVFVANVLGYPDAWGMVTVGFVLAAYVYSILVGRLVLAPVGFGAAPGTAVAASRRGRKRKTPAAPPKPAPAATAEPAPERPEPEDDDFLTVERPGDLPTFADVGGMGALKKELDESIGLLLAFTDEASTYGITWNGLLLHGPPGVGKTFFARAVAGEFGLNFIRVASGDLVSAYRGESGRNVERAFRLAARSVPCVLLFDEFDSIAQNREDSPDQEARRTVNQLLQSLEEYRVVRELVVMAATNDLDALDPALVRPGRFDRHVRVDLPDRDAREAIFAACLHKRPVAKDVDLADLARRSKGLTPAVIAQVVELASLSAFREAAGAGSIVAIDNRHLLAALRDRGGRDRPTVEEWTWDRLVLAPETKTELRELERVIANPDLADQLGVEIPTGVLLTGPPGTGKTTIAKVLAAQARCSFYPVSAADITSKWLGESERNIKRLFRRARDNAPSIVFVDEIDAIASRRGEFGSYGRQLNELLQQMDGIAGQQGIFVLAATNRPDQLDPALLRGGRLSRTIEIPLPDRGQRRQMLELMTDRMASTDLDLDKIADATDGFSGADLHALCQQAGLKALVRESAEADDDQPAIEQVDFDQAVVDLRASKQANRQDFVG
jgi:transitional endoplasmic reticulum ATPase